MVAWRRQTTRGATLTKIKNQKGTEMTKHYRLIPANEARAILLRTAIRAMELPKQKPTKRKKPAAKARKAK
jgi:DNA-directed RNA polymerase subunit H (RpoH/RPB5)